MCFFLCVKIKYIFGQHFKISPTKKQVRGKLFVMGLSISQPQIREANHAEALVLFTNGSGTIALF